LVNDPALAPFDLGRAATLAPKNEGGLNIESLAADGDKLWIGFRNPQNTDQEALLVPLLDPLEIINPGARAKFGDPVALKLGRLGVRDMVAWNDGFLIIAGDYRDRFELDAKPFRLFFWKPGTDPNDLGVGFGDLNPETIMILGEGDKARILILSDDGQYPGRYGNAFRGVWLQPTGTPTAGVRTQQRRRRGNRYLERVSISNRQPSRWDRRDRRQCRDGKRQLSWEASEFQSQIL